MRGLTVTILVCVVIVLIAATIICHIISLATDYWLCSSSTTETNFLNIGLFVACFDNYTHPHENPPKKYDGCAQINSDTYSTIQDWLRPGWLKSCQVLAIIALLLLIVGTILFILLLICWFCRALCCDDKRDRRFCCERCMVYAAPILFIFAGVFMMCTVMVFADNAFRLQCKDFWVGGGDPNNNDLSWSWGFEIAATIFSFLSGGILIWLVVVKTREEL